MSATTIRPFVRVPDRSDAELLAQISRADTSALGALYDRYARDVWRVAYRMLGSMADAEDVVHLVFLKLPQIAASHDGRANVRSWLLGICVRIASRHQRSARRFFKMLTAFAEIAPASTQRSPEAQLSDRQELRIFEAALACVAAKKRTVFMLVEIEGLTSDEAARALGIPAATVRTRLHHARREIDAALEAQRNDRGRPL